MVLYGEVDWATGILAAISISCYFGFWNWNGTEVGNVSSVVE